MAKASRARITVRRFERPPPKRFNETSRHANVARRSVFFFSRVEQKKQHKLSEKVVDFCRKVVNFWPFLPNFFRSPPHPLLKVAPNGGISY